MLIEVEMTLIHDVTSAIRPVTENMCHVFRAVTQTRSIAQVRHKTSARVYDQTLTTIVPSQSFAFVVDQFECFRRVIDSSQTTVDEQRNRSAMNVVEGRVSPFVVRCDPATHCVDPRDR
jgi:hypothetical protein